MANEQFKSFAEDLQAAGVQLEQEMQAAADSNLAKTKEFQQQAKIFVDAAKAIFKDLENSNESARNSLRAFKDAILGTVARVGAPNVEILPQQPKQGGKQ